MKKTKPSLTQFTPADPVTRAAATAKEGEVPSKKEFSTSAINIRQADWRLLRRVAEARIDRGEWERGRPSVSKVIQSLIDLNRDNLLADIQGLPSMQKPGAPLNEASFLLIAEGILKNLPAGAKRKNYLATVVQRLTSGEAGAMDVAALTRPIE